MQRLGTLREGEGQVAIYLAIVGRLVGTEDGVQRLGLILQVVSK